ncbi:hypothetical protein K491DRAFT_695843 [Lophiostoma macrostomum CBS 122681]|uniref:Uncharacterized protein n=1 Tax=Lophiostoma macrostomum CBS 122681 TaxID=1314788 RepID=A0A6A6SYJ3_9PLEO|nr:hypothetical protein K491DRAFT_695843 [Lophiostoma macrostomum CBS 122681]
MPSQQDDPDKPHIPLTTGLKEAYANVAKLHKRGKAPTAEETSNDLPPTLTSGLKEAYTKVAKQTGEQPTAEETFIVPPPPELRRPPSILGSSAAGAAKKPTEKAAKEPVRNPTKEPGNDPAEDPAEKVPKKPAQKSDPPAVDLLGIPEKVNIGWEMVDVPSIGKERKRLQDEKDKRDAKDSEEAMQNPV